MRSIVATGLLLLLTANSFAQQQYPTPMLNSLMPVGGKAGTTVEVTLEGTYLDEVKELYFSDPSIKATYVAPPPPKDPKKPTPAGPPKFTINIPANATLGGCDVRAVGKWGMSNPRIFVVSNTNEIEEKENNSDVDQAQQVPLNTIVNGRIAQNVDVDYFKVTGTKGQRLVVHCAASSIDSRLTPVLQLYTEKGRMLASNREYQDRDAVVDYVLPEDGDYLVRLSEFTHQFANNDSFYRLQIGLQPWIDAIFPSVLNEKGPTTVTVYGRNLPGGKVDPSTLLEGRPLEKITVTIPPASAGANELKIQDPMKPHTAAVDGFHYRVTNSAGASNPILLSYATGSVTLDNGDNATAEKAQPIAVPGEVCGRIEKKRDRDRYVFEAKKGDVFIFEGFADRMGSPMDLFFKIRRLDNRGVLGEYDEHTGIPAQFGSFFTLTNDPIAKFTAPIDGKYELMVSSRASTVYAGPRHVYRICIRKEQPDFRIVVVGNVNDSATGCTLWQGGHQDCQVVCFRQDGFDGEVKLTVEGLPGGVKCPEQFLGPKQNDTRLIISADAGAANWAGSIKIKGTAMINGKPVVQEARTACIVWPSQRNIPSISRLCKTLCLAVRPKSPYSVAPSVPKVQVPIGGKVEVKMMLTKNVGDLKGNVQMQRLTAPVATNGNPINAPNLNLPTNKGEVDLKFNVPTNTEPGTFNLVYQCLLQYQLEIDPKTKKKQNVRIRAVTAPLQIEVYNQVADLSVSAPSVTVKSGAETPITIKVKRLHDYKGTFTVQLLIPNGFRGVSASNVTIPANKNEIQMVLKSPAKTKAATSNDFKVRAQARVGSATMTHETTFEVKIVE